MCVVVGVLFVECCLLRIQLKRKLIDFIIAGGELTSVENGSMVHSNQCGSFIKSDEAIIFRRSSIC